MISDFQQTLDHIQSIADSTAHQGRLFERLMKSYFLKDPLYRERFPEVWLWSEWAKERPDFSGTDIGIDLVAAERGSEGEYCAIQCKCFAPDTKVSKPQIDSFVSASAVDPFAARIFVNTGGWGPNALKVLEKLEACTVIGRGQLESCPIDWPDLLTGEPEDLVYRAESFSLRPHQREALERCRRRL